MGNLGYMHKRIHPSLGICPRWSSRATGQPTELQPWLLAKRTCFVSNFWGSVQTTALVIEGPGSRGYYSASGSSSGSCPVAVRYILTAATRACLDSGTLILVKILLICRSTVLSSKNSTSAMVLLR